MHRPLGNISTLLSFCHILSLALDHIKDLWDLYRPSGKQALTLDGWGVVTNMSEGQTKRFRRRISCRDATQTYHIRKCSFYNIYHRFEAESEAKYYNSPTIPSPALFLYIYPFLKTHIICFPLDLLFPRSFAIQNPESLKRKFSKQLTQ